jgi:hypothetical protein
MLIALGLHPNSNSNIWLAKENSLNQFLSTPFGLNLGLNKVHETDKCRTDDSQM